MIVENVGVRYRVRNRLFSHSYFDALSGVSFEVNEGETLGVIGRNGCGKSTLLKVLAGIYAPDSGRVIRDGKKVSLLALGVGFDLDLSGEDNALLSAMFLGFSYSEAKSRIGAIREFSELGSFFDEPMKTYSTGMRSRLGFAVAITMHSDVLLIDEVLSVGDAQFRVKAETAISDRVSSRQTVVLVSHSGVQVEKMCQRVIWLEGGRILKEGDPKVIVPEYEKFIQTGKVA